MNSAIIHLLLILMVLLSCYAEYGLNIDVESPDILTNIQSLDTSYLFEGRDLLSFPMSSCQNFSSLLSPSEYPLSTCASVVKYPFYIPVGVPLERLEKVARTFLNQTALLLLPNTCQVALKTLVCANVYLKCYPGANPTDPTQTGWNPTVYSDVGLLAKVPFERPCRTLCVSANTQCLGLLSLFGLNQNCSARFDYSFGLLPRLPLQYDSSNNPNQCNLIAASKVSVGLSTEKYQRKTNGICSGIVDSLYVFPAGRVHSSLAPLQPPNVVQSIIESELTSSISRLPSWVSASCYSALKRFYCKSEFPRAANESYGQAFGIAGQSSRLLSLARLGINVAQVASLTLYYPSFPSREICLDYQRKCKSFFNIASRPDLNPNCFSTTTLGNQVVELYPNKSQTIISLSLTVGGASISVPFTSTPDYEEVSNDVPPYTPNCPHGFVVPDDPSDSRIRWIEGTGCAVACRVPILTDFEYTSLDRVTHIVAVVGIPLTFIVFLIYISDENKRNNEQPILLFAFFAFVNAISFTVLKSTPEAETCANNAVGIESQDGISVCTVTSYINIYCLFACTIAWTAFSVDKFLKIVWGWNTETLRELNLCSILLYPLISTVGAGILNVSGYSTGPKQCIFSGRNARDINVVGLFIIPLVFLVFVSGVAKLSVVVTILFNTRKDKRRDGDFKISNTAVTSDPQPEEGRNLAEEVIDTLYDIDDIPYDHSFWDVVTAVLFTFFFFCLWVIVLYFRIRSYHSYPKYEDSFTEWAQCAFANYDGATNHWHQVCGKHPAYRQPYGLYVTYFTFIGGEGLLFAGIILANPSLLYATILKFCGRKSINNKSPAVATDAGASASDVAGRGRKKSLPVEIEVSAPALV